MSTPHDELVPKPQSTILDTISKVMGDEEEAGRVMANPSLLSSAQPRMRPTESPAGAGTEPAAGRDADGHDAADDRDGKDASCACGGRHDDGTHGCCADHADEDEDGIPLKALDDIGRATAQDVREALHQVIDPELGIDVIDLGLVYGIEIDAQGRAIITMTLTTPACPLTDLIEDECASTLAGLVEEFRIDWTWNPQWTIDKITPSGRDQLAAIGFNLDNMPQY